EVVMKEIRSAVAEIGDGEAIALKPRRRQRRAHEIAAFEKLPPIALLDRPGQQQLRRLAAGRADQPRETFLRAALVERLFEDESGHPACEGAAADVASGDAVGDG